MTDPDQLPALPDPVLEGVDYELWGQNAKWDCYSKGQMQDYASTAIATERARADALQAENTKLKTTMVAAAEEIAAHWDAHCDAEGYGPQNLQRRLEEGIPAEYGYTAGAFAELKARADALEAALKPLAALGLWVLDQTRGDYIGSDLNGGEIQDKAEDLGLLARVEVKDPCSEEYCSCAEYYDKDEWPVQCLRYSPVIADARALLEKKT